MVYSFQVLFPLAGWGVQADRTEAAWHMPYEKAVLKGYPCSTTSKRGVLTNFEKRIQSIFMKRRIVCRLP